MKPTLRLVKSPEEEKRIHENKVKESGETFNYLIVQAICFKKFKEYSDIINLYFRYKQDENVDIYLRGLNSYKYLYNLGVPSAENINRIRTVMLYIKADAEIPCTSEEEKYYRQILSRLMIRALILERPDVLNSLSLIGNEFRKTKNVVFFKNLVRPLASILKIENLPNIQI